MCSGSEHPVAVEMWSSSCCTHSDSVPLIIIRLRGPLISFLNKSHNPANSYPSASLYQLPHFASTESTQKPAQSQHIEMTNITHHHSPPNKILVPRNQTALPPPSFVCSTRSPPKWTATLSPSAPSNREKTRHASRRIRHPPAASSPTSWAIDSAAPARRIRSPGLRKAR